MSVPPSQHKQRLAELMKSSMKSGDKDTLQFVRNLHNSIRKKEIDDRPTLGETGLDDAGVIKIVMSAVKQRQDSIEQFKAGNRADLVAKEEAELKFLQSFLPTQMSETELRSIVDEAIKEAQATTAKDMGKVMKILVPKTQGKADGGLVSKLVKEKLGG